MRSVAKIGLFATSLAVMVVSGIPALAFGVASPSASAQAVQTTTATDPTSQAADRKAAAQTKLAAAKLKVCQKRETAITNIMSRLADRGQKQLTLFSTIADRTETFYTNKGKTLSTYDTLVSDVSAKKAAAQTAVDAVKTDSTTFSCDGSDPKGAATVFKTALKSEITALKDYKTAVKNLIVGVKSVQGTTTSTSNKTTGGN